MGLYLGGVIIGYLGVEPLVEGGNKGCVGVGSGAGLGGTELGCSVFLYPPLQESGYAVVLVLVANGDAPDGYPFL